jgi:two-component sensor histidine kinase
VADVTKDAPIPGSPTRTFASPKRWAHAPPSGFIFRNAWRVKPSMRSSKPKRPSGAGSHASCTTRPARHSRRSSSGSRQFDGATTLPEARQASTHLRQNARSTLEKVGRLAFALRPAALDEFGLVSALETLGRGLEEQGGPRVELEVDLPAGARLPAKLETTIFRVTQEALTNVVKHAGAETVRITFARRERSVVLAVEDYGRGFSRAQLPGDGFGLVGMRERVASVNGAVAIESRRGTGTRLTVEIPLPDWSPEGSGGEVSIELEQSPR